MTQEKKIPALTGKLHKVISSLRPTEKIVFGIFAIILFTSAFYALQLLNIALSTEVPAYGGTYQEGIVGYARFINPVLGFADADKDMSALIYSGLLKPTPEGKLVGDLAESWAVSDDGLTYSVTLKPGTTFHDGKPLTTADIAFTIQKILDPTIKSPKADSWSGVTVNVTDPLHISFTLKKPYAPFLENLTLGILPEHIWKNIGDDTFDVSIYNREPIGSGPFKIKKAYKDESGIYESYDLAPFENYASGKPYISHFIARFYKGEEEALNAYKHGQVEGLGGISPASADGLKKSGSYLISVPLPRVFAVFFNQSAAPVLVNKEVREALDVSVDRSALIKSVLSDWGNPDRGPIPNGLAGGYELTTNRGTESGVDAVSASSSASSTNSYIAAAQKILSDAGWKIGASGFLEKSTKKGTGKNVVVSAPQTLKFTISVPNVPELAATANILKETWGQLGANVTVQIFEPTDLTQKVIRPRTYDALLFGQIIGRDLDLYPFWHSSQRNDPGLNVALYTNLKADKDLETGRSTSDESKRLEAYQAFEEEVANDIPAVFLYSPDYIYAGSSNVHDVEISNITSPSERFMNVSSWYIETERVWNIFKK